MLLCITIAFPYYCFEFLLPFHTIALKNYCLFNTIALKNVFLFHTIALNDYFLFHTIALNNYCLFHTIALYIVEHKCIEKLKSLYRERSHYLCPCIFWKHVYFVQHFPEFSHVASTSVSDWLIRRLTRFAQNDDDMFFYYSAVSPCNICFREVMNINNLINGS